MKLSINQLGVWVALLILAPGIAAAKTGAPEFPEKELFFENPHHHDQAVPDKEKKLRLKKSQMQVSREMANLDRTINNLCNGNNEVYRVNKDNSELKVTSFKNWNVPVKATFKNYDGYVYWDKDKKAPQSTLLIDTTSWDSGAPDRDSRVKYYLLKAQKKKFALARLDLHSESPASRTVSGALSFRDRQYGIEAMIKKYPKAGNWFIRSAVPFRLIGKIPDKDMTRIMKLCNHKSLSPAVDLEWNLRFDPACKGS